MCEKHIRAHSAGLEAQNGIKILNGLVSIRMMCENEKCIVKISFNWQLCSSRWKLRNYVENIFLCFSLSISNSCSLKTVRKEPHVEYPHYRIAHAVVSEALQQPSVKAATTRFLAEAERIYRREHPCSTTWP